jgi:hypothetical protein
MAEAGPDDFRFPQASRQPLKVRKESATVDRQALKIQNYPGFIAAAHLSLNKFADVEVSRGVALTCGLDHVSPRVTVQGKDAGLCGHAWS